MAPIRFQKVQLGMSNTISNVIYLEKIEKKKTPIHEFDVHNGY